MASQFEAIGLEPAGENDTYFQDGPLRWVRPDERQTKVTLLRAGKQQVLLYRRDFLTYGDPGRVNTSVEARLVYVGFGITAPGQNYDDYACINASGKIVALFFGAPARFPSTFRARCTSSKLKAANAAAHGAVGVLLLDSPDYEQMYPFDQRGEGIW
jgi:hypothetical protein